MTSPILPFSQKFCRQKVNDFWCHFTIFWILISLELEKISTNSERCSFHFFLHFHIKKWKWKNIMNERRWPEWSFLVPEIWWFKEPKHNSQNCFNANNNNNSQNCDVIRFTCWSVSWMINYMTASTEFQFTQLCKQAVAGEIQSILVVKKYISR